MPNTEEKAKGFRSLATTLVVYFLALSLAILTFSTTLELYTYFQTEQAGISNQQKLIAQDAANAVKDFIEKKFDFLASAGRIGEIATAGQETQKLILNKLLGFEPAFRQLALFNLQEQELAAVSRFSGTAASQLKDRMGADILFQAGQAQKKMSLVYIDEVTSEPLAVMTVPVTDSLGDLKGILMAEVNLKSIWDLVGGLNIGETGLAYVVNRQGDLIAFGDVSRVLKGENLIQLKEVSGFVNNGTSTKNGVGITKGITGNYVVTSYVALGTPDWAVVVEMPVWEAYKNVIEQFILSLLILLLNVILAVLAGSYLSRKITGPIIELRNAAEKIGKGDLAAQINIESKNEIGQTAEAFNKMAAELRELHRGFEEKIAERTQALDSRIKEITTSNQELDMTKTAVMNLLEDERELEHKLEEEKQGVERKIVERTRELNEEQARFIASINNLSMGFILADLSDDVLLKNQAISRLLGIKEDFSSVKIIDDVLKEVIDLHQSHHQVIKERKPMEIKSVAFGVKFLRILIAPVTMVDDYNSIIGYVMLFEDITEAKVMERSREDFFAVASHELRTPLTAIRGNSSLLQEFYVEKIKDKEALAMIGDIHEASIRLIGIVNDFLDVSRLEQNKIEFKYEPFDIKELVESEVRKLEKVADDKKLYLKIKNGKGDLPKIYADKERTRQVMVNFIGNAINYTEKGGVEVFTEKIDGFLKVLVKDTGRGIPPANQNLLFRKFQQAGQNTFVRDATKGAGLGLYISKLLVEEMGGEIKLEESIPGKGSIFSFTLPVAKE
jgi:PAS domain S-box-containing protein